MACSGRPRDGKGEAGAIVMRAAVAAPLPRMTATTMLYRKRFRWPQRRSRLSGVRPSSVHLYPQSGSMLRLVGSSFAQSQANLLPGTSDLPGGFPTDSQMSLNLGAQNIKVAESGGRRQLRR